jgi:hypothetical protein
MLTFIYPERIQLASSARSAVQFAGQGMLALMACLISIGTAWFMLQPDGEFVVLCAAFFLVLVLIAAHNLGVATALAMIAVLNGLPGLDIEEFSRPNSFRISDLVVAFLLVVLAAFTLGRSAQRSKGVNRIWIWALVFTAWWLFTLLRTVLLEGVPVLQAALYGRDFLYFILVLALFAGAIRSKREIKGFLITVSLAAAVYSAANVGAVMFGEALPWLIHPIQTNDYQGLTRIYAYMTDAAIFILPIGAGLALLASRTAIRVGGAALFSVAAAGILAQFGRMLYYSLALGLLLAVAIWMTRPTRRSTGVRRVAASLAAALVVVVAVQAGTGGIRFQSQSDSAFAAVSQRAVSGFTDISAGSGTVEYRQSLSAQMAQLLEGHWAEGLGFLHPSVRPALGVPNGSIRNTDVGIFNSLMTMGVVGTLLLYLPLLGLLWALVRRSWRRQIPSSWDWFAFGTVAWLIAVLVGSISLVTLFSVQGLVVTACVVGCAVFVLDSSTPRPITGADP